MHLISMYKTTAVAELFSSADSLVYTLALCPRKCQFCFSVIIFSIQYSEKKKAAAVKIIIIIIITIR